MQAAARSGAATAGQEYYEDLCMKAVNQCIGRVIRHARDWAAIVLADARWAAPSREPCSLPLPGMPPKLLAVPSCAHPQNHIAAVASVVCLQRYTFSFSHVAAESYNATWAVSWQVGWLCTSLPCALPAALTPGGGGGDTCVQGATCTTCRSGCSPPLHPPPPPLAPPTPACTPSPAP